MNRRTRPILSSMQALLIGTALVLGSGCATTQDKQVDGTDPDASAAEADDGFELPEETQASSRDGKVSRKPYYHPGTRGHIEAMEQSLKSLESIPVAKADTASEEDSE